MSDVITYRYATPSAIVKEDGSRNLFLSKYSEVEKAEAPCYFWGRLTDPYIVSRCLVTLSNVVQSGFTISPAELQKLRDPIVTAGNEKVRFEGFSQCAGVYARVDVLPGGYEGEFPAAGTTNVDFNAPMIIALSRVQRQEHVLLGVGKKEVVLEQNGAQVVERKVPLPIKWLKGLTSVQVFFSVSDLAFSFNRIQALQLLQSIPAGKPKEDFYLVVRGNKPQFSPVKSANAICLGGLHRLKLIEPLIPLAQELRVFSHPDMQSTTWQLYFGCVRFTLSLSREAWRGFSGEGAALESLIDDVPDNWIDAADKYAYANQAFNPVVMAMKEDMGLKQVDNIAARLSAMGLLGYDLDENHFFYRRLPFKLTRIMSLNPRLRDAEKLLTENKVEILSASGTRVEARVAGTGVDHTVILDGEQERCTCTWYSRHQGERGLCKHVLAVKKKIAQ